MSRNGKFKRNLRPISPNFRTEKSGTPLPISAAAGGGGATVALTGVQSGATAAGILGVTFANGLTGVTSTGVQGTLSVTHLNALTGYAGTGAVGTFGPQMSVALAGVTSSGAVGTLTPNVVTEVALIGVQATGAVGIKMPGDAVGLSSVLATGSIGTLGPTMSLGLTGYAGTGAAGLLSVQMSVSLAGVQGTGAVGTPAVAMNVALVGVSSGASAVGTLTPEVATVVALTGVQAVGEIGIKLPGDSVGLSSVLATGAIGTLGPAVEKQLTGVSAVGAKGDLGVDVVVPLVGVQATGEIGNLVIPGDVTVALTGVEATGEIGQLTPEVQQQPAVVIPALGGGLPPGGKWEGTKKLQQARADVTIELTGVSAVGQVGRLTPEVVTRWIPPPRPAARRVPVVSLHPVVEWKPVPIEVPLVGYRSPVYRSLKGVGAQGFAGDVSPSITVALTGVQATGEIGTVLSSQVIPIVPPLPLPVTIDPAPSVEDAVPPVEVVVALAGVSASGAVGKLSPLVLVGSVPETIEDEEELMMVLLLAAA